MIQCFKHKIQEPYVIVKKSEHLPIFPEEFTHGRDKVIWIKHIQYIGYKFGELNQSFEIDIPHPISTKTVSWRRNKSDFNAAIANTMIIYNVSLPHLPCYCRIIWLN